MPRPLVFLILALPLVGAYAMYASGIVVIYQASRVLNLAHGAMATVPAYLVYTMVSRWDVPIGLAAPAGVLAGALLGIATERFFVRRLRSISSTAQTVGTVAAFGLLISVAAKVWGTGGLTAPSIFPDGEINVGSSILRYGHIGLLAVAVTATIAMQLLFQRTWFGLAMRGAAVNRKAAALMGVNPDMTSRAAWAIGGGLAAMAGILLAAVTVLHPYSLSLSVLPAFVAALIGGLGSLTGALVGSAIVGVVIGFVPILADLPLLRVVLSQVGGPELVLAVTAMIVMAARGKRLIGSDVRDQPGADQPPPSPKRRRAVPHPLLLALLVGWVWIPGVPFTILGDANQALIYTMVAASLVLLTGWIGQISLAQAAFVGVGAFGSALLTRTLKIPFPFTIPLGAAFAAAAAMGLGVLALRVRGLYLAVATLIFGWMADQYLFSSPWFVGAGGSATADVRPIGYKGGFPYFDLSERRTFYFVALAGAAVVLLALGNLRSSKTGRAFFAIRGSEMAAASLGIDVTRYKLLGFAMSGLIAGLAGTLVAAGQQTIVPSQFSFTNSLLFLSIAVVGGMQSMGGVIASSIVFSLLNELFFRVEALRGWLDVVGAALLAAVLLFYPGGLARAPEAFAAMGVRMRSLIAHLSGGRIRLDPSSGPVAIVRRAWASLRAEAVRTGRDLRASGRNAIRNVERDAPKSLRPLARRIGAQLRSLGTEPRRIVKEWRGMVARVARLAPPFVPPPPPGAASDRLAHLLGDASGESDPPARGGRVIAGAIPVLDADGITVRFGGVTAVNGAALQVHEGEIVGLIGPNGAGKTTMFNAVAGFVRPSSGRVRLRGEDITDLDVHERAALGMGRTFQAMQLASELTVRENLLVATHVRNPSSVSSHLVITAGSLQAEQEAMARVEVASRLVGIDEVLDRRAGGLPFGTLRLVELARALVTGAPLIMLDEPASGLDEAETQRFTELLRRIRDALGISLLLIEHDVRLVMSLCDHVYVLDRGDPIAQGPPSSVQTDPAVVAAYLGSAPASGEQGDDLTADAPEPSLTR